MSAKGRSLAQEDARVDPPAGKKSSKKAAIWNSDGGVAKEGEVFIENVTVWSVGRLRAYRAANVVL